MKMLIMKIMLINSIIITILTNPLSIGVMLVSQTFLMTILLNKMMNTSWFMMITFLMMIGGLLILFTYMCSIASNEKFKLNLNLTILLIMLMLILEEMLMETQMSDSLNMLLYQSEELISMVKLYNEKSMIITIIMVVFLFLTMIVINKIVKLHQGPMRKKTYE
uniref:NADH dehydrogenase subunit 6 n=1 Tax=Cofana yasumatsui TaxID=2741154 RepID=A0A6M8PED1_9HEMI|nr:NADH dehydrogenase subunit 6 [Cofana yasumatsui]QKG63365.1 NADH dehydrogenase subunit 6 [Cofana yasumatsui]